MQQKANICGDRIRQVRLKSGLKQVDLAVAMTEECDITMNQSDISDIERGTRSVKDFELVGFADILEESILWFVHRDKTDMP